MKVLAINGSPSGEHGKTWWALEKFIKGMEEAGAEVTTVTLASKKVHHCTGELACWFKTPGKCIHKDDMDEILPLMNDVDALVLASPVYVDGMTGLLKNCIDRMVPIIQPYIELREGHARHPARHKNPALVALVSVCGFPELDNFAPLVLHVKAICKNMNAKFAGSVLRPAAPGVDAAKFYHPIKSHAITSAIKKAGQEFVRDGAISEETSKTCATDLFTAEQYLEGANKEFKKALEKLEEKIK